MNLKSICLFLILLVLSKTNYAQKKTLSFGEEVQLEDLLYSPKPTKHLINWFNVNTDKDTWRLNKNLLICTGLPIGVMRSEKQYENFIIHVEWKHINAGGNSGIFVWSDAQPDAVGRLPGGVEVQMLELDWVNQNTKNGVVPPIAYVHGELFGVGGVETIPDNPRGTRSKSIENRAKGKGEWNKYTIICVDGTIKLAVNGKFVNGIRNATIKKGYLCLESEGSEIHFKNFQLIELPPSVTDISQIVKPITK